MRIALLSTCALATPPRKYGGTELVVAELAQGLTDLGHRVTVYATGDSEVAGELRHCFDGPAWPPDERTERRHARFAWKDIASDPEPYDVVHMHQAQALRGYGSVPYPKALTVHHCRVDELVRQYCDHPDVAYVAISRRQAELSPEISFARVVHHGLDPARYELGDGDGGYVAFLGRFAREKAPHLAIDAARAAGIPVRLGGAPHEAPGYREYFECEMRPRLAQPGGVEWLGELGHWQKARLLAGARALLFPLDWEEPFGLVMIEAMLVGTPVIAFARGSAPEVVEDGLTGWVVRDAHEMAACIGRLHRIDRARCRARAVERWSTKRMAKEYCALYEELVERHGRAERNPRVVRLARTRHASRLRRPALLAAASTGHGAKRG
jgi:glycosyltransferase involved in cell wall biosynthesis